jgi:hypothetical protein
LRAPFGMIASRWMSIAIVWIVTLIIGGVLWQRFTRIPARSAGLGSRSPGSRAPTATRRVVPLWLALVLLIVLITAAWLTLRVAGST